MTALLLLLACPAFDPVSDDQPCLEVGYSLAYVAESCSGDREVGNARYEQFVDEYVCVSDQAIAQGYAHEDLYDCAFAISALPCEVADAYGDDLASYMAISAGCPLVAEPRQ